MKNKTRKRGGEVIASGGFGCIFDPPLLCEKKKKTRKQGYVSKLMLKEYAQKEYKEIQKYKKILEAIPNYTNYFLVDSFSLCKKINPLTKEDLENFDKKCKAIKKRGISGKEVNDSLGELNAIQMPYGGLAVDDYVIKIKVDHSKMKELNNSLIQLLQNGILPMNRLGVYHGDIKDSNVLVEVESTNHMYTRLIDWGLSCYYQNSRTSTEKKALLPKEFTKRPFQFNMPFSVILFQTAFLKTYKSFLKKNPYPDYLKIRSFVMNYVLFSIDKKGPGHVKNINSIIKQFFKGELVNVEDKFKDDLIEFEYTFYFIFEYLSKILFQYTRENEFQVMDYFENVFLKNVDVWGFVMIYISFTDYLFDVREKRDLTNHEAKIILTIKEVYVMMMRSCCEPVNVNQIILKLKSLDGLFSFVPREKRETTKTGIFKTISNKSSNKTKKDLTTLSVPSSSSSSSQSLKSKSKTKKNFFTNLFS